jgi:hypothetical protein
MDRNIFARVLYGAYCSMGKIVGSPIVFYNTTEQTFGWTSSIYALKDNEIKIVSVRPQMFGEVICSDKLENYILIDNDLWDYVLLSIRYGDKSK